MWLAEQAALGARDGEQGAEIGVVTIGGAKPAVMLEGEKRQTEMLTPGGVYWAPAAGQQVAVLRCGDECFVCGQVQEQQIKLESGDVLIKSGAGQVYLHGNGAIELVGEVNVRGNLYINGVNILSIMPV